MLTMKYLALAPLLLAAFASGPSGAATRNDLRSALLQPAAGNPAPRKLTPQEQAELRSQLIESRAPAAGKHP